MRKRQWLVGKKNLSSSDPIGNRLFRHFAFAWGFGVGWWVKEGEKALHFAQTFLGGSGWETLPPSLSETVLLLCIIGGGGCAARSPPLYLDHSLSHLVLDKTSPPP